MTHCGVDMMWMRFSFIGSKCLLKWGSIKTGLFSIGMMKVAALNKYPDGQQIVAFGLYCSIPVHFYKCGMHKGEGCKKCLFM
jgi:hypothetical protein